MSLRDWPAWLEWEPLSQELTLEHLEPNPLQLSGPLELRRDSSLRVVGSHPGHLSRSVMLHMNGQQAGEVVPTLDLRGKDRGGATWAVGYVAVSGATGSQVGAETRFTAFEVRMAASEGSEIAQHVDWFCNGSSPSMIMPDATTRVMTTSLARTRDGMSLALEARRTESGTKDSCRVQTADLDATISIVPQEIAPAGSRPLSITYRSQRFMGDDPDAVGLRRAFAELVGFLLGRQLLHVGWSRYSADGSVVEALACQPWGLDLEVVSRMPSRPPVPLNDGGWESTQVYGAHLARVAGQLLGKWRETWNNLGIHDALWQLWLSRRLPLGANLPALSSGLDALSSAWHQSNGSRTKGVFVPSTEFAAVLAPVKTALEQATAGKPYAKRLLGKLQSLNQNGGTAKQLDFFADIGVSLSELEKGALRARHAMAHGGTSSDVLQLLRNSALYENVYHRVMLTLLGYQGHYVDYAAPGWPSRDLSLASAATTPDERSPS